MLPVSCIWGLLRLAPNYCVPIPLNTFTTKVVVKLQENMSPVLIVARCLP